MFPRPNFCCLCGEKIERVEWHVWTSRRFCEVCESENVPAEWLPRAAAGVLTLFGLFGVGSALRAPDPGYDIVHSPVEFARRRALETAAKEPRSDQVSASEFPSSPRAEPETAAAPKGHARESSREVDRTEADSGRYFYCGAATKKGTACTRKVKGGGRCWQHKGMEAMIPESELVIRPVNTN